MLWFCCAFNINIGACNYYIVDECIICINPKVAPLQMNPFSLQNLSMDKIILCFKPQTYTKSWSPDNVVEKY